MRKPINLRGALIFIVQVSVLVLLSTQAKAVLVEFNALQNYSSFSFEGTDRNGDGYLVYDEVSRLTPPITNLDQRQQTTYEYFSWGVFDINNAIFLNDTFSAWDVSTRPTSYATEEEWVQYIFETNWGPSSNYTIEQMSIRPALTGGSRIVFDGINGVGFSQFYSVNVSSVPLPSAFSLMLFGLAGFGVTTLYRKKENPNK